VEYKKAPDLAARNALCDQVGGQESQAWDRNIQANLSGCRGRSGRGRSERDGVQFRPSIAGIERGAFPWDTP
jgi:hypothetical protein